MEKSGVVSVVGSVCDVGGSLDVLLRKGCGRGRWKVRWMLWELSFGDEFGMLSGMWLERVLGGRVSCLGVVSERWMVVWDLESVGCVMDGIGGVVFLVLCCKLVNACTPLKLRSNGCCGSLALLCSTVQKVGFEEICLSLKATRLVLSRIWEHLM